MFRAALLWIVLTLAGGQNAALYCHVWCHSGGGTAGACKHQTETTSPRVIANDDCTVNGSATVFVRDDAGRNGPAPTVKSSVPQFAVTPPASGSRSRVEAAGRRLLEFRPLVLALRI